jgi:hypothetical protein
MIREHLELNIFRYNPNTVRGEVINFGLLLRNQSGTFAAMRFVEDDRRLRAFDPDADVEMLAALRAELETRLTSLNSDNEAWLKRVRESFSNSIEISESTPVLAESAEKELAKLIEIYLAEPTRIAERRAASGRRAVFNQMRDAFEFQGVWQDSRMVKNIAASTYTRAGDPLEIDCGYQPNGTVKLFHAVSLEADVNAAKVLAYTYPRLRDGLAKSENAAVTLTAVTEDALEAKDEIAFALETLQANGIQRATVSDLPQIAATARLELRL